jgi:hypothetical protein
MTPGQNSLMNPDSALQAGGPSYFNQSPRQLSPILLVQAVVTAATWTKLLSTPRGGFITIQDFRLHNQGGSPMDCYFAFVGSGSAFSSGGGLVQDDVYGVCSEVPAHYYPAFPPQIALSPKQDLWFYSTEKTNVRLSGWLVKP